MGVFSFPSGVLYLSGVLWIDRRSGGGGVLLLCRGFMSFLGPWQLASAVKSLWVMLLLENVLQFEKWRRTTRLRGLTRLSTERWIPVSSCKYVVSLSRIPATACRFVSLPRDEESWNKGKHGEVNKDRKTLHRDKISASNLYESSRVSHREEEPGASHKPAEKSFAQSQFPKWVQFYGIFSNCSFTAFWPNLVSLIIRHLDLTVWSSQEPPSLKKKIKQKKTWQKI